VAGLMIRINVAGSAGGTSVRVFAGARLVRNREFAPRWCE